MTPYLSFNGQCEAAFKFYEQCLGGQLGAIFRYAGTPMADQAPADWQDKVMHGYEEPKGFSLSLQIENTAEAERIFHELSQGGRVVVPLEKTFWAARFGMMVDRFGISWLVNCEESGPLPEG
ncbi:MAG TPA: VOC family protein [Thermoanaerobaculia bacterium]|jgi:PhnB protein|nr:VOC family protein [Thermoanaerobaculia bacterium]